MCFGWHHLGRAERVAVAVLGLLAIACHTTHLLLAAGLILSCFVMLRFVHGGWSPALRISARPALVFLLATLATIASNRAVIGRWSLTGNHPPFLLGRSIVDGPGRLYILDHRDDPSLAIARFADRLPLTTSDFLWEPDGICQTADRDTLERIRRQETQVVIHAALARPLLQLEVSTRQLIRQLRRFGAGAFERNPYTINNAERILPDDGRAFVKSRQYRNGLPSELFTRITYPTVLLAAVTAAVLLLRRRRLLLLGATIAIGVLLNAAVTGILSEAVNRYQARIIWLIPFLAALAILNAKDPAPAGG
jgi:hypothetical protein